MIESSEDRQHWDCIKSRSRGDKVETIALLSERPRPRTYALIVQSDAPDFDLWAQRLMVLPDGSAVKLGEDIRRARFRNSYFKSELWKPDQIAEIPFEFYWMARRIPTGARLRLTIAPLNSPAYQKNYNTGGRIGYERIEDARMPTSESSTMLSDGAI